MNGKIKFKYKCKNCKKDITKTIEKKEFFCPKCKIKIQTSEEHNGKTIYFILSKNVKIYDYDFV